MSQKVASQRTSYSSPDKRVDILNSFGGINTDIRQMGKTNIEFTVTDFVAARAVSLDWPAVALDRRTVERVTENDNALG